MPQFYVNVTMDGYFMVWADDEQAAWASASELTADGSKPSGLEIERCTILDVDEVSEARA
jgi:hypothetical protein